jgi:hypothetical protein
MVLVGGGGGARGFIGYWPPLASVLGGCLDVWGCDHIILLSQKVVDVVVSKAIEERHCTRMLQKKDIIGFH